MERRGKYHDGEGKGKIVMERWRRGGRDGRRD